MEEYSDVEVNFNKKKFDEIVRQLKEGLEDNSNRPKTLEGTIEKYMFIFNKVEDLRMMNGRFVVSCVSFEENRLTNIVGVRGARSGNVANKREFGDRHLYQILFENEIGEVRTLEFIMPLKKGEGKYLFKKSRVAYTYGEFNNLEDAIKKCDSLNEKIGIKLIDSVFKDSRMLSNINHEFKIMASSNK